MYRELSCAYIQYDVLLADYYLNRLGDEDVVDLMDSVLAEYSRGKYLPTVRGQMTCKHASSAAVEWELFSVQ